jgi:TonB family protein
MIEQLIKQNWRYPNVKLSANLTCAGEMRLAADGTSTAARLVRTSGRADFDGSALRAVNETEKVPPPPGGGAFQTIEINFNLQDLVQ